MSTKRILHLNIPLELHDAIQAIADDAGITKTAWATIALRTQVRNWDSGLQNSKRERKVTKPKGMEKWDSGWLRSEVCWVCGKMHDPLEHGSVSKEDIGIMKGGSDS